MSELGELYRQMVVEHGQRPRNTGTLSGEHVRQAEGDNPLCGDRLTLYVALDDDDRISAVRFDGEGCAISTASASLLTEAVQGLSVQEANALFERFRARMTGTDGAGSGEIPADSEALPLGKLEVLSAVRNYPMRVKCATLAWHTLHAALTTPSEAAEAVSTE